MVHTVYTIFCTKNSLQAKLAIPKKVRFYPEFWQKIPLLNREEYFRKKCRKLRKRNDSECGTELKSLLRYVLKI